MNQHYELAELTNKLKEDTNIYIYIYIFRVHFNDEYKFNNNNKKVSTNVCSI